MLNLLTDIPGLRVGHAHDPALASGVTAILFDIPATVSVAVHGGAPGTRETDLLAPDKAVNGVDAIVLSGGSAFGLDAASGVQALLREQGRGLQVGPHRIPLVSQAICFDLMNGGNKQWGRYPPYRELGYLAAENASTGPFALGTAGGGFGATTVNLKGGLGSASAVTSTGIKVAALVVVNAMASAIMGDGPHFWAAPYERDAEFGGRGWPPAFTPAMQALAWKGQAQPATTIALIATDAALDKAMVHRLAISAHDGLPKALRFAHALMDGDTVFAAALGGPPRGADRAAMTEIAALAGDCLARAIARGVFEATALPFAGALPDWQGKFGGKLAR